MKKIILVLITFLAIQPLFSQTKTSLKWWSPEESSSNQVISGKAWSNESSIYHRLPLRAENKVRKQVWDLAKQAAGLSIRFKSNANKITIEYTVKGMISMSHMPATGFSGLDLYTKSKDGYWQRCCGRYSIKKSSKYRFVFDEEADTLNSLDREYQLLLPLYNEVGSLKIGVNQKAFFKILPTREEKPIVAYGSSICQGACASRPGMAWTNILERNLNTPIYNLGFSGYGKLDIEVVQLISEIDAKLYILDCLPNLHPVKHDIYQRTYDAVKKLKEVRPFVPVIITDHTGYADEFVNKKHEIETATLNKESLRAFEALKSEGFSNIYYLKKEDLGLYYDSYVDQIHPNDYGMMQYAKAYEKLINKIFPAPIRN